MNRTQNEKILKRFGKHLEKIRLEKKLSLRKLADDADVDFSQIHRIEKGKTNPSLTMLLALAGSLNITIKDLLDF
ncbi:MAG TPA: helix-turn-helix transcriptional regulator [Chitinophagaceae bacterium]|jgi:transcriptional regulator with XRE-family HTH domain|nr:helix-turn-helix transcriptional regulator [Chitinophagaceae bacterium]